MLSMIGAFAEFERSMIVRRQIEGIAASAEFTLFDTRGRGSFQEVQSLCRK